MSYKILCAISASRRTVFRLAQDGSPGLFGSRNVRVYVIDEYQNAVNNPRDSRLCTRTLAGFR